MEGTRPHMEFNAHPGAGEAAGIVKRLFQKQINRADVNIGRRQIRQVAGCRGRAIRRNHISTADHRAPAKAVMIAGPAKMASVRVIAVNAAMVEHGFREILEHRFHRAAISGQKAQSGDQSRACAFACNHYSRGVDAQFLRRSVQP